MTITVLLLADKVQRAVENRNKYILSWRGTVPLYGKTPVTNAEENEFSSGINQERGTQEPLAFPEQTGFAQRPWASLSKASNLSLIESQEKEIKYSSKKMRIFYCTNHLRLLMGYHKS